MIDDIRKKIEASQPALQIDMGQVIGDMLGDLMTSVQPIEIKIFGDNPEILEHLSEEIAELVEEVDGTEDVNDGIVETGPLVNIIPNYKNLAQYGITPADFQFQLQTALEGVEVGSVFEKEQMTPIRMLYPNSRTLSVEDIKRLQVFTSNKQLIPISSLAEVKANGGMVEIYRENLQMMGVVSARIYDRSLGSIMAEIKEEIADNIHLPAGYHIEYGGAYKEQ